MNPELQELKDEITAQRSEQRELREALEEIQKELARYKGFVGGCLWIIATMIAAIKMLWPWIAEILKIKTG